MKIHTTSPIVPRSLGPPKHRPPVKPGRKARKGAGDFDWESLVSQFIHPVKVAVIEAMRWIDQPLSATELTTILGRESHGLGVVAYHVNTLAKRGVVEATHERQARGARETYYSLVDLA